MGKDSNSLFLKVAGTQIRGLGVGARMDLSSSPLIGGDVLAGGQHKVDAQEMVHVLVLLQRRPTAHPLSPPLGITLADLLSPEDHADGVLRDLFRGEPCWIMDQNK